MSRSRSVLLDLDGTLIDSRPGIAASCLAALRALGHSPDETFDITPFIGPPLEDVLRGLLGSELYPGIGEALEDMRQAGLRIYMATSKREVFARRIAEHLNLTGYFDGIYGSVHGGALDHKPELLAHVLSERNLIASEALMVGDRRHDIVGAHAVKMRGLGVLWGYVSRDELETAGADHLVERTADLAHTVLSMLGR